jgi:nitrogen fixation/metabolism regulation signal transduction histidine kinase
MSLLTGGWEHLALRVLAIANVAALALLVALSPPAHGASLAVYSLGIWLLFSILALPTYVLIRLWMSRGDTRRTRNLQVDLGFALAWVAVFCAVFLYGMTHYFYI